MRDLTPLPRLLSFRDLANRLKTTTTGTTSTTYTLDGDGKRLKASTGSQASKNTNYAWDVLAAVPQLAAETDGSGSSLRQYLYGQDRIAMTTSAGSFYYHPGSLSSTLHLTSAAGAPSRTATNSHYAAEAVRESVRISLMLQAGAESVHRPAREASPSERVLLRRRWPP